MPPIMRSAELHTPIPRLPQLLSHERSRDGWRPAGRLGGILRPGRRDVTLLSVSIAAGVPSLPPHGRSGGAGRRGRGERCSYANCKVCHRTAEAAENFVGPASPAWSGGRRGRPRLPLFRRQQGVPALTWDEATLKEVPQRSESKAVPGTKMVFRRPEVRAGHRQCHRLPQAVRSRRQEDRSRRPRRRPQIDVQIGRDDPPW